jgi:energy-converting hydrogenase Eha subunit B
MDGGLLIHLLVQVIVVGLVCWLLWWLIGYIGLPEPFNKVARVTGSGGGRDLPAQFGFGLERDPVGPLAIKET